MTDMTNPPAAPDLPIWQARSFWLSIAGVLSALANAFGWSEVADEAAKLPDVVMPLITAALMLWAYVERLLGSARLVWRW